MQTGCAKVYSLGTAKKVFRRVYKSTSIVSRHERALLKRVIRCQATPARKRRVKIWHKGWKAFHARKRAAYLARRQIAAITPYDCGSPGRFAIPCRIVACESGFSWSAYNPSGASGPYQLLGKGAPMPANTAARRLTHHRIAYNLWAGGAGASHWVCK